MISETWMVYSFPVPNGIGYTLTPEITNDTSYVTFSGLQMTNAGPITASSFFSVLINDHLITVPLSGDNSDTNNPIVSSYKPGATSAMVTFYKYDPLANPQMMVMKTVKLVWIGNKLSGYILARPDAYGFEALAASQATNYTNSATCLFSFGNYSCQIRYDYRLINGPPASITSGSVYGTSHFQSPVITITSPAPNALLTSPVVQVNGVNTAFHGVGPTMWRWAAPSDDPSLDPASFSWNAVDNPGSLNTKRTGWSTTVDMSPLGPGTNWFWAMTTDSIGNPSAIVTRKFFYSVRSPLTLGHLGNGTVIGSRGVTNGAMLEIGRSYTVIAKPKDRNTVFRDWRDGASNAIATLNPWNFQMQSNMTIIGNFVTNPFPAIAGTYSGLFYDTFRPPIHHDSSPANSGYTTITVKPDGTFTGTVLFGAGRYPIAGRLFFDVDLADPDGVTAMFAIGPSRSLSGRIQFPSDGSGHLLPTPTLSMTISNVPLNPLPLLQSSNNAVAPGLYNFVDNVGNLSVGASYGTVIVSKGQANVVMHLADGSPAVTFSTPVRKDGSAAIFIPLNRGEGMILATLNLNFLFPIHASGGRWTKPADAHAKFYPGGLVENLDLVIARYTPDIGKSIVTDFGMGEIIIANDTISYSAQFIYSPANNRLVAVPGQTNVTMNLTFNPVTGLVDGTITFAGHSPFHVDVLIGGENIGYTLDTDHSVPVVLRATPVASLGNYDDGFVLADGSSTDAGLGATAFFGFQNASQLVRVPAPPPPPPSLRLVEIGPVEPPTVAVEVLMHRYIQIAPHLEFIVTDTFDSMDVQYPNQYPALPSVGPYTGPFNPADFTAPAVTITPSQRTTQYIAN